MYIKKEVSVGNLLFVQKYHTWRYGKKGIPRSCNVLPTSDAQKKINERQRAEFIFYIILANFCKNDIYITLTYQKQNRPPTMQDALKNLKGYIDRLRRLVKKHNLDFKYVTATEVGKRGAVHHHIIIKKIPMDLIFNNNLWCFDKYGRSKIEACYSDYLDKLAAYFTKQSTEPEGGQDKTKSKPQTKWTHSRNLIIPEIKKTVIRSVSWHKQPRGNKKYDIKTESIRNGICEWSGQPYQSYIMVRRI